jgi:putative transposase
VHLVRQWRKQTGLNQALNLADLPKSTWYDQQTPTHDKYRHIKKNLKQTLNNNASYGYRRAHSELTDGFGHSIGKETVRVLMKDMALQMAKRLPKPRLGPIRKIINEAGDRVNRLAQLEAIRPIEVGEAGVTDFTEIVYDNGTKKAQLMTVLDYRSRAVLGWGVADRKDTQLALLVWRKTKYTLKRLGLPVKNFIIHSDQDPVLTGHAWARQIALKDEALLSYSLNGCHGNTRMESWHSRFKEENKSLFADCRTLDEVRERIGQQVRYYNSRRRHSALDNQAPMRYLKDELNLPG